MGATRELHLIAAQYLRKSTTEHQRYSIENQSAAIQAYAETHNIKIAHTYTDSGKSGLKMGNRDALKQLLLDVQSGTARYRAILVYDVSRWGRFQDADASAYYEYACKRAGICHRRILSCLNRTVRIYAQLCTRASRTTGRTDESLA